MKLTPLDIHHKEFRKSLNGYNQQEVDAFLDEVADEFERLFKENIDLSERLEAALERVRSYEEMKDTLQNTLLVAQKHAEDVESDASKRAELKVREAELKAQEIVQAALAEKQKVQADVLRIRQAEREYRQNFRSFVERHLSEIREVPVPDGFPTEEEYQSTTAQVEKADVAVQTAEVAYARAQVTPAPRPVVEGGAAPRPAAPAAVPQAPVAPAPAPQRPVARPSANARSLTLGEVGAPAAAGAFGDVPDFAMPDLNALGGEDDVDIEEID